MLDAPFPYFGGKKTVAPLVWSALGSPKHYIEPFFGSGAVLLSRPNYDPTKHVETINDKDGFICNVWRGLQYDPDEVAKWCDWPVNHADLCARRARLIENESRLLENLVKDDMWHDPKLAGYWIWAASCWIGSGLTRPNSRAIPQISDTGKGAHKLSKRPHLGNKGTHKLSNSNLYAWFHALSERLRHVRVVCGDYTRVCGGNWQDAMGDVGIFFDPPYSDTDRDIGVYYCEDSDVAKDVCQWALERGNKPSYRIVIAGYDSEHGDLVAAGWTLKRWRAGGGYARKSANGEESRSLKNRFRECLWFSPHCYRDSLQFQEE